MAKIYTKTGDTGDTGLFGGPRVRKDAARIEAYGSVDELNALLGLTRTERLPDDIDQILARAQNELFDLGAELASPNPQAMGTATLGAAHISALEAAIDQYETALPPLAEFILPGGTRGAALLHLSRTVCRRAERRLVTLTASESIAPMLVVYLNRLGDLLFVLARRVNQASGRLDMPWRKSTP